MEQHTLVHGMTFAGEKAMDEILERIYKARVEMLRRGHEPSAVYLGYNECAELQQCMRGDAAFTGRGLTVSGRSEVFGLQVYQVDADDHVRVV